jgi:hypothetical protein
MVTSFIAKTESDAYSSRYSLSNSTTDTNAMDSLKDAKACTRDAALMAQAGINTIYVMAIDTNANHDDCFSIFNAVGIYVMVVLRKDGIFETTDEDFLKSYTTEFLKSMFNIIDAVKDYENLLGFDLGVLPTYFSRSSGQIPTSYTDTMRLYRVCRLSTSIIYVQRLTLLEAFVRDVKAYISLNAPRPILVGANLHLVRTDELLDASDETASHMHYFSCAIDGAKDDLSRSDYLSFYNLGYFETESVEKQNASYTSLQTQLSNSTIPTWFSYMGIFDEADVIEYELRPDLVNDTLYFFNSSSQLIRPRGIFTGGARVSWTNTNMGWKVPKVNWGLTSTSPNGDVQLTENYDTFRSIIDQVNPSNWLSGDRVLTSEPPPKCDAKAEAMKNVTVEVYGDEKSTISLATDWALPTRPPGLDALIANGANGNRGQMVDVTVTTIAHAIRDSKGQAVTNLVLKPSSSSARTTTGTARPSSTGASSTPISTGAKAGIGVGAGIGGIALISAVAFFFLRRKKNRKANTSKEEAEKAQMSDEINGFHKAELATGPGIDRYQAELDANGKAPREVDGREQSKYELFTPVGQEPVELPVNERPVEVSAHNTR